MSQQDIRRAPPPFDAVARLIYSISNNYQTKYGGDIDDYLSEGHLAYVRATKKWNPTRGTSFSTYLHVLTTNAIRDLIRKRGSIVVTNPLPDEVEIKGILKSFNAQEILRMMSPDAATIAILVLSHSPLIANEKNRIGMDTKKWYFGIRRYLFKDLAWDKARILSAFDEIRELL